MEGLNLCILSFDFLQIIKSKCWLPLHNEHKITFVVIADIHVFVSWIPENFKCLIDWDLHFKAVFNYLKYLLNYYCNCFIFLILSTLLNTVITPLFSYLNKLYGCILGAFGYFEVTHDITKYTKAKPFEFVGKKTPLAVRFSTVGKWYILLLQILYDRLIRG